MNCKAFINGINKTSSNFFIITSPKKQWCYRHGGIAVLFSLKFWSIAQSVERMTVNHDVVGSSPTVPVLLSALCKTDLRSSALRQ